MSYEDVHLSFEVSRATGLQAAARLPLNKGVQQGIDSYVKIRTSFLPTPVCCVMFNTATVCAVVV